ncbi:hypothetical protein DQ384_27450 [Sphaerisporangium album]|uniref:Uncharacterized protein n=1 Tax=Sphaerisporangium album TaxID=509200 RepID=A0A367FBE5_9ACTN|nr:hypothetical protein [Sphaerisporangium album]RCG27015.1 hypothetical protein DQ384_27450 [Sphaerisporangium album]
MRRAGSGLTLDVRSRTDTRRPSFESPRSCGARRGDGTLIPLDAVGGLRGRVDLDPAHFAW